MPEPPLGSGPGPPQESQQSAQHPALLPSASQRPVASHCAKTSATSPSMAMRGTTSSLNNSSLNSMASHCATISADSPSIVVRGTTTNSQSLSTSTSQHTFRASHHDEYVQPGHRLHDVQSIVLTMAQHSAASPSQPAPTLLHLRLRPFLHYGCACYACVAFGCRRCRHLCYHSPCCLVHECPRVFLTAVVHPPCTLSAVQQFLLFLCAFTRIISSFAARIATAVHQYFRPFA